MRKIAVIGSTTFPLNAAVGAQVVDALRAFGEDVVFLTRGSGPFETFVGHVAIALGRQCLAFKGAGGADNFVRDAELVTACDELLAFVDLSRVEAGYTGTGGVIERALSIGRPVRAATAVDGSLVWADA